jgi:tripartite ATP-independent transporter DctM subunit
MNTMRALAVRAEDLLATLAISGLMLLPLAEVFLRNAFGIVIPGAGPFALNLTLWVGLLGAAIAAREGKLLTLATGEFIPKGAIGSLAHVITGFVGTAVATLFVIGGIGFVRMLYQSGEEIALGVRLWEVVLVIPFAFGLIAIRLAWRASPAWIGRAIAALGIVLAWWMTSHPDVIGGHPVWPWLVGLLVAGLFGAPIFALLGGVAMVGLLVGMGGMLPDFAVNAAHEELTSPAAGLAAIPLFTLAGFLLAEGRSPQRLLRMLRALVGWIPGGTAIAAASLCAFFTLFTGGSGVTILALGGLLLPAMVKEGYRERFSIGLLTASGSLGLLFPLSVPLILYAIVVSAAGTPIEMHHLFIGGLLPGIVMLGLVSLLGTREAVRAKVERLSFRFGEAVAATWDAKWEVLLPVVVLVALFGGYAKTAELAPVAALLALIIQRFIHKDLPTNADVVRVVGDCVSLVGGVLLILCVAVGLTKYFVLMQVPDQLIAWTQAHVEHRWVFLLCLNVFLLLVGTVMDIFSAIVVVAPLLLPLAALPQFGIDPVHLGVIFVANLELGYLHPPLGLNLLLASVRFKKPVIEVMWATLPMLGILAVGVLLITYWDWLTLGILRWTGMYTP